MSEPEGRGRPQAYSLAGEGMPTWLTLGFALVGVLTAVAAAWVLLADPSASPKQPSPQATAGPESGPPSNAAPSATPPVEPLRSSAKPSSTAASENDSQSISSQAPPAAAVVADGKRVEPPAQQAPVAKALSPVALVECPGRVTIMFKSNSTRPIGTDTGARLAPLREWLASHPEAKLSVEGHSDPIGAEQWNLILSYRRAKALVDLLRKSGVPQEQLVVRAAGQLQPIAGLPSSAAANRRVILQIEGSENCRVPSTGSEPQ